MTALPDLPLPPELAVDDEPLTDDDLDRLAEAALQADEDTGRHVPMDDLLDFDGGPAARHLVPDSVRAWFIEDDGAAEWACRKLAQAQAEHEALRLQAEDWAARIDHWFTQSARPLARRVEFFAGHLEAYAVRRREATGTATLTLPSGRVATRLVQPTVEVADEQAVIDWATNTGDRLAAVVRTVRSVLVSELRKLVKITDTGDVVDPGTGEVVPGVAVRPGGVTAKVTTGG